ncbi:uncharacterized protein AMSG_11903 [Thecamonas trahens ATCC 50062]|uniref:Uncharacterized protein n=1 Tax=Thecamonas trahens ATCC 50062 TaxID=461836 RepID=A0A0L0DF69_THETB|nr:hypothetical protein AMSG_11903 [Thecamonas trahens ATCC 50062]KNC49963.1 hypothetical protein AMSG_11903 [Thecamonas trahens ATCC 50062]|eukprot:XP_013757296.1 hypothetical protein AMSG_11903 [Thecamonas trahens ATCC 50062]
MSEEGDGGVDKWVGLQVVVDKRRRRRVRPRAARELVVVPARGREQSCNASREGNESTVAAVSIPSGPDTRHQGHARLRKRANERKSVNYVAMEVAKASPIKARLPRSAPLVTSPALHPNVNVLINSKFGLRRALERELELTRGRLRQRPATPVQLGVRTRQRGVVPQSTGRRAAHATGRGLERMPSGIRRSAVMRKPGRPGRVRRYVGKLAPVIPAIIRPDILPTSSVFAAASDADEHAHFLECARRSESPGPEPASPTARANATLMRRQESAVRLQVAAGRSWSSDDSDDESASSSHHALSVKLPPKLRVGRVSFAQTRQSPVTGPIPRQSSRLASMASFAVDESDSTEARILCGFRRELASLLHTSIRDGLAELFAGHGGALKDEWGEDSIDFDLVSQSMIEIAVDASMDLVFECVQELAHASIHSGSRHTLSQYSVCDAQLYALLATVGETLSVLSGFLTNHRHDGFLLSVLHLLDNVKRPSHHRLWSLQSSLRELHSYTTGWLATAHMLQDSESQEALTRCFEQPAFGSALQ